jgi:3-hydroxyacyl-CoA dehydrogenase
MAPIHRVAVLGAGVMGAGIAAHLANAGIPTLLFDIAPKGATEPKARRAIAQRGIESAIKAKPAALFRKSDAALITPCTYDDDADKLASCDWIVEVVVERLDIKQKVFSWVAANRREGSIVSSNTSGIPLADMVTGMPEEMARNFLITHFFNPVRYMRLLEIVSSDATDAAVVAQMARFCELTLGKGVVYAKDTPNFIGNRIGVYGIASVLRHMQEEGLTVEQVDAIFGSALGRPKSAVFRTADVVGLDTLSHVFRNLHAYATEDEERDIFVLPDTVDQLIAKGATGQKAGAGFYKKTKSGGKTQILVLDPATMEYRPSEKVRFKSIGAARKVSGAAAKTAVIAYADDVAGHAAWRVLCDTLIYSANRIPEIADDIVNVDRGMRWGFGWDLGPFETWDALGVRRSVERMERDGRTVPAWVKAMLASGRESFYARGADGVRTYATRDGGVAPMPTGPGVVLLPDLKATQTPVATNASASLHDLGDGVLNLEFHSKMNALDNDIIAMYSDALDRLDRGEWEALVVGNQDPRAFCAGANIAMILIAASQQQFGAIEDLIDSLQRLVMRAKYSRRPVVTAPHGLTLGGGAEVAMHSSATQASGELYMGLVEVGVGLIPGAGGCKELAIRYLGDIPQDIDYDPNPFVQKAFERIAMAQVSKSCEEARAMGYLRPADRITMNGEHLLADAKALALGLAKGGYAPPRKRTIKMPGAAARAAIDLFLYQMAEGGFVTPHDVTVGKKLAYVMTGGDVPQGTRVTEQDLLDLEREAFLSLCGEQKTLERIAHMLQTNKPLRN